MNRQRELARNTIILTVGKVCTQFVSFLLLPLYTALLLPSEYGIVDVLTSYIALLTPLFNWQFENGLFRFLIDYRQNIENQKRLISTVLITNIGQCGIFCVLYVIAQNFITSEFKIFLLIDVIVNIILNSLLQLPRGLGKNFVYSAGSFISAVTMVILNVVFIAGFRMGAYGMFIATILGKIVACVYLFFAVRLWTLFSLKSYNYAMLKDLAKYSLPLVPNQLSWWVVGTSDRTIISQFLSVASNGIYSVANKFSTVYVTFYNIFNLSWTESVSIHIGDKDSDEFLTDTINTMFNLFAAVDFGIICFMPFVFNIMINEQYADAYYQIPILMIAVLFQVVVGLYSVIYVALKKSGEIAKTSMFAALINISVDLILIKIIGLYAASISTLIAYAAMALYRYFDVRKYVCVKLKNKTVILACLMCAFSCTSYYSKNIVLIVSSQILVVVYAYFGNRKFLHSVLREMVSKARSLKERRG